MGLFTGISLVTFVECAYWILRFVTAGLFGGSGSDQKISVSGPTGKGIQPVFVPTNPFPGYS
jgi:hypothetical protein